MIKSHTIWAKSGFYLSLSLVLWYPPPISAENRVPTVVEANIDLSLIEAQNAARVRTASAPKKEAAPEEPYVYRVGPGDKLAVNLSVVSASLDPNRGNFVSLN